MEALTGFFGKVMSWFPSILALSTIAMADVTIMGLPMGRPNVENAHLLDSLTKEEGPMADSGVLEVTPHVADAVTKDIDSNTKATNSLRQCTPSSLRKVLNELPTTLDDTCEQTLQRIPKELCLHAHRLFQCLVAAIRPLRIEELEDLLAIDLDPEGQEILEAVFPACSSLITISEEDGSRSIQFSHPSIKDFLTSDRLRTSDIGNIRQYYISLDVAHITLARACLRVLLQLNETRDNKSFATSPLAIYTVEHWVHLVNSGEVTAWIRNVDRDRFRRSIDALPDFPSQPRPTSVYYAASYGFSWLAEHLIVAHGEDVNAKCGYHGTALHAALYTGHFDAVHVLLDHGANVNLGDQDGRTPLVMAYDRRSLEGMRLLLERGGDADVPFRDGHSMLLSHYASSRGRDEDHEVIELLLQHNANVNARCGRTWTPLHWASAKGHTKIAQLLLEYGADVNAQSNNNKGNTPLHQASRSGHIRVVQLLLQHGVDVHTRGESDWTAFQLATLMGRSGVAQLLLQHGAEEIYEVDVAGMAT